MQAAYSCFKRGNIAQAELLCREYVEHFSEDPNAYNLLGHIAAVIGAREFAFHYFSKALKYAPSFPHARQNCLRFAADASDETRNTRQGTGKFLLIKAWGFGFWADVDHVLGQLLLAEMTRRIPVIHWGTNSLFRSEESSNAFELYFEPVSEFSIGDLVDSALTYFPPKWKHYNLTEEDLNKWSGPGARIPGLFSLYRDEDVVVSDFHTSVLDLVPWIPQSSEYFGLHPEEIYRRLYARYLKIKPHIMLKVEQVWQRHRMEERRFLAVHVRGTDKVGEIENLEQLNRDYFAAIDQFRAEDQNLALFLLTDCMETLERYRLKYGCELVYTESIRGKGIVGVHYAGFPGKQVAEEVIMDVYLAARCDLFLGNGWSNVSTSVGYLKTWPVGAFNLVLNNFLFVRNLSIHNW
jgi:hypothetical protein